MSQNPNARSSDEKRRKPGGARGKLIIHDDFDDPLPESLLELFHEGPVFPEEPLGRDLPQEDCSGGSS